MRRRLPLLLTLALALAASACKDEVTEPAPVNGGEYLDFRFDSNSGTARTKILIEKGEGGSFRINADPIGGYEAQPVNAALADGRSTLKLYHLGWLWLPPSKREIGAKLPIGDVNKEDVWNDFPVWVVERQGGAGGKYYFHKGTGFLVRVETSAGGAPYVGQITGSNIPGLAPGT